MDEKEKIKVQQKLIDQLTKENAELREQVLYLQTVSENSEFSQAVQSMKESKAKYDKLIEEINRCKKEGLDEERFNCIKKSYYGALIRDLNDAEAIATVMLNAGMEKLSAFDVIETVAAVTFEDVQKRLEKQFDTDKVTISIIEPINGKEE